MKTALVLGAGGFIGSHLVKTLLDEDQNNKIVIYDNFSSGKKWHFEGLTNDQRLCIIEDDVKNDKNLQQAMMGNDIVYHFASNPDISKAAIDFASFLPRPFFSFLSPQ